MSYLAVNGGKKLHGEITNQSSKNSAEALLCASLMVRGTVVLTDVPQIEGVNRILELLASIGVKIDRKGATMRLDTSAGLHLEKMDQNFLWKSL